MDNLSYGYRKNMKEFLFDNDLEILSISITSPRRVLIRSNNGVHDCPLSTLDEYKIPSVYSLIDKDLYLVNKLISIYGDLYDYSLVKFCKVNEGVKIICKKHGIFEKGLSTILNGVGCSKCNHELKFNTTRFIEKATIIHDGKYDYSLVNYTKSSNKIDIICPKHGKFTQVAGSHLHGRGCRDCANKINVYSKTGWVDAGLNSKIFDGYKTYIIRCFNDNEEFIKIGKTFTSISIRFAGVKLMPYNYEVIKIIEGSGEFIFDLENVAHDIFREYKYIPEIHFGGITECYNTNVLKLIDLLLVYKNA